MNSRLATMWESLYPDRPSILLMLMRSMFSVRRTAGSALGDITCGTFAQFLRREGHTLRVAPGSSYESLHARLCLRGTLFAEDGAPQHQSCSVPRDTACRHTLRNRNHRVVHSCLPQ